MRGKFTLRPYKVGDSKLFEPKKLFGQSDFCHERLDALAKDSTATVFTCWADNEAIAVIGGSFIFPGVMDLWSLTSEEVRKYPLSFARSMRRLMDRGQHYFNVHRYQTAIRCSLPELRSWAAFLGMTQEGIMKKFGPDQSDHYLYAKVY